MTLWNPSSLITPTTLSGSSFQVFFHVRIRFLLSAEGFRCLILPVQLKPFPKYPGLHVQLYKPLVLLQKARESP